MSNLQCKFCADIRKNSNSLRNHERLCKKNPNRQSTVFEDSEFKKRIPQIREYKQCENQYTKAKKLGLPKPQISEETRDKLSKAGKGRAIKDDIKKKISESLKKAHKEGRAWNIGKSRWNNESSYPEKFFMQVIENEFLDKEYVKEFAIGIYSADFCLTHLKKIIEIDGDQHQRFEEYIERDKRKDEFVSSMGYKILRIAWKDMFHNTKDKIKEAYNFIHS